jgi:hypothetical protein
VKGVELPINILVVVAIAVIVLLGMVALYLIGFNPISVTTAQDSAKNMACRTYMNQYPTTCENADIVTFVYQNVTYSLLNFSSAKYGCAANNEGCVRKLCGCPGY